MAQIINCHHYLSKYMEKLVYDTKILIIINDYLKNKDKVSLFLSKSGSHTEFNEALEFDLRRQQVFDEPNMLIKNLDFVDFIKLHELIYFLFVSGKQNQPGKGATLHTDLLHLRINGRRCSQGSN
ncbi:hypothetical protein RCL_jg25138.t1 [Rhizophagus clarus]|uniref:Uncharacterized protein n=1 Tax=Rhizophagus clarus TaxID=94130 RepID=A0A8H3LS53_9GLOM|nr:hypothetical protein RCL_jg25138.t1 [Rhizophagus clarus]